MMPLEPGKKFGGKCSVSHQFSPFLRLKTVSLRTTFLSMVILLLLGGCGLFPNEGVVLSNDITETAAKLNRSASDGEFIVTYQPSHGMDQNYSVTIGACGKVPCTDSQSCITVEVEHGRSGCGDSYRRFVLVPKALAVTKHNATTELVLRKNGDTISLVALR